MEKREFNKNHLMMIIVSAIGILTIAFTLIIVIKDRNSKEIDIVEDVIIETEEPYETISEPDLTLTKYENTKELITIYNDERYKMSELESIVRNSTRLIEDTAKIVDESLNTSEESTSEESTSIEEYIKPSMNFSKIAGISELGLNIKWFDDYLAVYKPEYACVIIVAKPKLEYASDFTTAIRKASEEFKKTSSNDKIQNIFSDYEYQSYNGYSIVCMCEDPYNVITNIIRYMENLDKLDIEEFESKYTLTDDGAYLIEEETAEISETE